MGEQTFTQKADTHGIMFALTRQMIINDDNRAFNRLAAALNYVVKVYEQARGPASEQVKAELREGIQIVHAELEAAGNLDRPSQEAAA